MDLRIHDISCVPHESYFNNSIKPKYFLKFEVIQVETDCCLYNNELLKQCYSDSACKYCLIVIYLERMKGITFA